MKRSWLFCVVAVLGPALAIAGASLSLSKKVLDPGESVTVSFNAPGAADSAWIGLIPSSVPHGDEAVNDQHDLDYRYLDSGSSGSFVFEAPNRPGSYDFRLNDGSGREIASVGFEVKSPDFSQVSLRLASAVVAPGGELHAGFTAPATLPDNAWVGIIPSSVEHGDEAVNDQHDLGYEYLSGRTSGAIVLSAPAEPGSYDLRLNDTDDNGREIASVPFEVRRPDSAGSSLRLESTAVLPGDELPVHFTTPPGFAETAWLGIVPASVPHGDEEVNDHANLGWEYLGGRTEGTITLFAPTEPGAYDVRLHDTDSAGREVASTGFSVKAEVGADDMAARLQATGKLALYGIHFAVDSAEIAADSSRALAPVGQLLIRQPDLRLVIEGHTDATGSAEHNLDLSRRRAEAVLSYLVATFDIAPERLESRGFGQSRPIATNDTASGRALNRRVELVLAGVDAGG